MSAVGRKTGSSDTPDAAGRRALADEADLIRRCCLGERSAEEAFYRAHRRQVAANLHHLLNDRADLDDLVQEVFVTAFRTLPRYRGEARLTLWLHRICVEVATTHMRKRGKRASAAVAERSQQRPARARVEQVLEGMATSQRILLCLHEIEELDAREIGYIVGASALSVRTRLFYARRAFYQRLAAHGES